jgi:transcriptional regulator with XRE-family HTH domain
MIATRSEPEMTSQQAPKLPALIRQEIAATGKTQDEIAIPLGTTQQTLSRWASGKQIPGPESLPALARFLRIPIRELKELRAEAQLAGEDDQIAQRLDGIASTLKALTREQRRLSDAIGRLSDSLDQ